MTPRNAYSTRELSELLKVTRQAIGQRAKREGWKSVPRKGRGGGHFWLTRTMPQSTLDAIARPPSVSKRFLSSSPVSMRSTWVQSILRNMAHFLQKVLFGKQY